MNRQITSPDSQFSPNDLTLAGGLTHGADAAITKEEFEAIAAFRYAIRRFLRFTETAARKEHITPQQHQLLLAIKGYPDREYARVSELAERLQMRQHSMVGLIDRTEAQGLVRREQSTTDRRQVNVHLTPAGEVVLYRLALQHRRELGTMRDTFQPEHQ
jgi:DNA-binding MarR family transcriptional regulator